MALPGPPVPCDPRQNRHHDGPTNPEWRTFERMLHLTDLVDSAIGGVIALAVLIVIVLALGGWVLGVLGVAP